MATASRDGERDDDAVTGPEVFHPMADFDHLSHEFVPEDVALFHRGNVTVVKVQVGPADRGRGDADDAIAWVEDLRVVDLLDLPLFLPIQQAAFISVA